MRLHFIGVGGSGMSAVARLAHAQGAAVTGTDKGRSLYFAALEQSGMDVRVGHDARLVDGADAVVVSSAVRDSNPELARARQLGIPVWHRSEALAWAMEGKTLAAIAGSHGKTTTSAMVAHALHGAGIDASFAVGARVFGIEGAVAGGYAGSADVAVIEADESDGSFLRYRPEVGVITNIEPDHLDHYGTKERLFAAFDEFAASCRILVVCADDARAAAAGAAAAARGVAVVTYGTQGEAGERPDVEVTGRSLRRAGSEWPLDVPIPGAHNRLNAAAAWAAAVALGAEPAAAAAALASFGGTGRRFQLRGEAAGVRVVDDYAHHPTEVAAVIAAARAWGAGRLVLLFQPALFTRTRDLAPAFGAALSVPDVHVVLAPVHGDREDPIQGVSSDLIASHMELPSTSTVVLAESLEHAAHLAAARAQEGDVLLTVGSGSVTQAADWILDELRDRRVSS